MEVGNKHCMAMFVLERESVLSPFCLRFAYDRVSFPTTIMASGAIDRRRINGPEESFPPVYDDEDAPQPRARPQDHSRSSSTARSEVSGLALTNSCAHSLTSPRV